MIDMSSHNAAKMITSQENTPSSVSAVLGLAVTSGVCMPRFLWVRTSEPHENRESIEELAGEVAPAAQGCVCRLVSCLDDLVHPLELEQAIALERWMDGHVRL